MSWTTLWRSILANLFTIVVVLLGLFQVLIGHWVVVVFAGREGPGLALGLVLGAGLVGLQLAAFPAIRRAARGRGLVRRLARAYLAVGVVTIFVGLVISFSWLGFFPLAGLLQLVGVGPEAAYTIFRIGSAAVVGLLVGMFVWGFTGGQWRVERTHVAVPIEGLAAEARGLRIVQLSDLHIGNGLEGPRLERLVAAVNALDADLVVLTGDIFDYEPRFVEDGARRLGGLRARRGVYGVLGNHDVYTGKELVVDALARLAPDLKLLRGEVVPVPGVPLFIAGVDDPGRDWTVTNMVMEDLDALAHELPDDAPTLLLVHRPEAFPHAARIGFPLVLAGHTHGGQLAIPSPSGRWNLARFVTRFDRGLHRIGRSVLYVNRGIGVAGPSIRLGALREIATIELVAPHPAEAPETTDPAGRAARELEALAVAGGS